MEEPTPMERALLRVARTLAAAIDLEDITAEITTTALEITGATGAYVERVVSRDGMVEVIANAGTGTPGHGLLVPFPGSLTEEMITTGEPLVVDTLKTLGAGMAPYLTDTCDGCAGLVVPLLSEGDVVGALVLLRAQGSPKFDPRDANTARILGDLASVALKRVVRDNIARERGERFRSLAENAAEAIVTLDTNDCILFANPATARIFGYSVEELQGMTFTSLIPERYRARHRAGMQRYIDTGVRKIAWDGVELVGLHRDGHEVPLEVTFGEFEERGERLFTGLMRDITVRQRIQKERDELLDRERAARTNAERGERRAGFLASARLELSSSHDLATTMQNLADLAIQAIADWCVIDIMVHDDRIERMAGAHRDPTMSDLIHTLMAEYAPTVDASAPAAETLRAGNPVIINNVSTDKLREISRDASHAEIVDKLGMQSLMSVPLNMAGATLGVITLVRMHGSGDFDDADFLLAQDLASRAALAISNARHYSEAEEARGGAEQHRIELERVIESKARLIRGFSHDIKNPLGAADGYAQLLLDGLMGELTQKQDGAIQRIRVGIATALGLINDVVEFARAESGQIEVRPSPFNADALVREIVAQHAAAAEQAGVKLCTGTLDGGSITCDAIRIRQILANLISNAIKYGGSDGDIVVAVQREEDEHSRMLFSVTDAGQGIPIEKQHMLFEEFTRLHTGKKEGSGLGLAISRRIARVLGGDIVVDSGAGRGSTFTLWVPVARNR